MSDDPEVPEDEESKGSKMPLILGVVLALVGGGGGFFAVSSGMLFGSPEMPEGEEMTEADAAAEEEQMASAETEDAPEELPYTTAEDVTFVPLDAIVISLPPGSANTHLRFRAQLEVKDGHVDHVRAIAPRVIDILNGYLRAVDVAELEDHRAFPKLRAQMLRRVQIVAGADAVQNILIQEFILN